MSDRQTQQLREPRAAAIAANGLLVAADQQFLRLLTILAKVFVKRHGWGKVEIGKWKCESGWRNPF
jgi:hypothetical protein